MWKIVFREDNAHNDITNTIYLLTVSKKTFIIHNFWGRSSSEPPLLFPVTRTIPIIAATLATTHGAS